MLKLKFLQWISLPAVAALALFVALAPFCFSQQLTGSLAGTAQDTSGAVIPNAKITLKNQASGDVRTTVTDNSGYFSLSAVPPASYTITVMAPGFTTWEERDVVMGQGDNRSVANIHLKVGGSTTEVQVVSGTDAVVPVDTAEISTTLNTEMIQDITIASRDAGELLKIMPGMALTNGLGQGSSFNTKVTGTNNGPVGSYSANGTQPNGAMAFMLDGANLTDPGNAGTQIANINQDMTAEVKVLMSGYGAEYAKGPVIFEAFSKSGGSQFHGEGYFYAKNSTFNSIDAYAKSQIASKVVGLEAAPPAGPGESPAQAKKDALAAALPNEHYYYAGGNVGGPILIPFTSFNKSRKKLFFWAGYEYMNQHPAGNPINYNVPTVAQKNGDFSEADVSAATKASSNSYAYNNVNTQYLPTGDTATHIDPATFDPNIKGLLAETGQNGKKVYPDPNLTPSAANGYNNFQYVSNVPQNRWEATGKVDYALNDNTKITGSYTRQIENDTHPLGIWWVPPWTLPYPSAAVAATVSQEVMTNFTHVFNPTTTNEFVFTLARYINPSTLSDPSKVDRAKVGFQTTGLFGHTASQIPNIQGPWGGALPNLLNYSFDGGYGGKNTFGATKKDPALYDNFSKVVGSHTLKAGVYWDTSDNLQSNSSLQIGDQGTYNLGWGSYGTGNLVADFLLGRPGNYQQLSSVPVDELKFHQWSLFAQDSWKAGNQLTFNYGMRFDHMGQWTIGNKQGIQVFNPATYVNALPNVAPGNTGLEWHAIDASVPSSGWKSPLFYLEPRVGIAYDVFGTGRTVIRGGFAIFRYQVSANDVGGGVGGPEGSFSYTTPVAFEGYGTNSVANLSPGYTVGANAPAAGGYQAALAAANVVVPTSVSQNGSNISALQMGDNRTPNTMDWNVTVSQALPWRSVFEISYVANKSSDELINGAASGNLNDINNVPSGGLFRPDPLTGRNVTASPPPCGVGGSLYCASDPTEYAASNYNANDFRPLMAYGTFGIVTHGSFANYNSLQASWQKQSGPVTFLTNYTFSKLLGIRDGQTDNGAGNGTTVDPFSIRNNYGPLAYDHTNIFNAAYVWNMPSPIHGNRLLGGAVNGWQLSGYTTYQSGANLQANLGGNLNAQFPGNLTVPTTTHPELPDYSIALPNGLRSVSYNGQSYFGTTAYNQGILPSLTCNPAAHLHSGQYFNPACFGVPAYGQQGSLEWPYMRGPAYFNSDLALFKNFRVTENQKVQVRVSATNFLNHPLGQFGLSGNGDQQLSFIGTGCFSGGVISNSPCAVNDASHIATQYLSPTNTNTSTTGSPTLKTGSRIMEIAVKYYF